MEAKAWLSGEAGAGAVESVDLEWWIIGHRKGVRLVVWRLGGVEVCADERLGIRVEMDGSLRLFDGGVRESEWTWDRSLMLLSWLLPDPRRSSQPAPAAPPSYGRRVATQ